MNQLIASDLHADGVFAPCKDYIDKFNAYGNQYNGKLHTEYLAPANLSLVHPIMLASFAMQESTCNAGATGGNGEAGLMQISPPNCEAGYE
jgi:membrane-bound lytic murein transglycosylase MltF